MAYMSQDRKAKLAPAIKAVCKKYGIKASLAVRNHSTLVLNLKGGKIDFISNSNEVCSNNSYYVQSGFRPNTSGYCTVNPYHYKDHYSGKALKFLSELIPVMNDGNHDRSDIMTDYFDVGWYIDINIGRWNAPYKYEGKAA